MSLLELRRFMILLHIRVQKKSMFISCCEIPSFLSFKPCLFICSLKISKLASSWLLDEFSNSSKKIQIMSVLLISLSCSQSLTKPKNSAISDFEPELLCLIIISESVCFNLAPRSWLNLCSLACSLSFGKVSLSCTSFLTASW